nr:MAG TPA: hypothetical protein [Caudoviricetes sp.]
MQNLQQLATNLQPLATKKSPIRRWSFICKKP